MITTQYSDSQIKYYRSYYELDKSLVKQYAGYIGRIFTKGDFGYSIYYKESVLEIVSKRIWWTLGIVSISMLSSITIGILLGGICAWNRNKPIDTIVYSVMIFISEIPGFLIGIILLFVLGAQTGLFPISGGMTAFADHNTTGAIFDILHHAVLPVLTLVIARMGDFFFLSRNSMISIITKDYIRTARAKGLTAQRIIFRHVLKNAISPIMTKLLMSFSTMLGGAVIIENVFNYPGLGRLIRDTVFVRDYPLLQGIFLIITFMVLFFNFISDIITKKTDARITI